MRFFCVCMKLNWNVLTLDQTNSYSDRISSWRTLFLPHFFLPDVFFNPESWGKCSSFAFYILRKICLTVWQQRLLICPLPVWLSARLPVFFFLYNATFPSVCPSPVTETGWLPTVCHRDSKETKRLGGGWEEEQGGDGLERERARERKSERNKAEHKTAGACNSVS